MRILTKISFALNLLVIVGFIGLYFSRPALIEGFLGPMIERKVSFFDSFSVNAGDVVFLGDSITEGGDWHEIFPDIALKNRGIGGDTTSGVLARLHQLTDAKPSAVFLKIGTNDLTHGPSDRSVSYAQYQTIIQRIQDESSETKIFLQSVLPRDIEYREEVEHYNKEIQRIAAEQNVAFIDLYPHFLGEDGSIRDDLSNDELHLMGEGYVLWQGLLADYIESL